VGVLVPFQIASFERAVDACWTLAKVFHFPGVAGADEWLLEEGNQIGRFGDC